MKLSVTEELSKKYGFDQYMLQGYSISLTRDEETKYYSLGEGEPEDMIFGRNLQGPDSIINMIKSAHEAGTNGEELEIERTEEKW